MNNELNNDSPLISAKTVGDVLAGMIQQLEAGNSAIVGQLKEVSKASITPVENTATSTSTNSTSSNGGSVGRELLNAVNPVSSSRGTNILTSLFLGPVWKGLFSLFGGGSENAPAPLTKYAFPEDTRTDLAAAPGPNGQPSTLRSDAFGLSQANLPSQAPINISIQALDARSILDRSDDIAAALKQALLSNHEINDSMSEL